MILGRAAFLCVGALGFELRKFWLFIYNASTNFSECHEIIMVTFSYAGPAIYLITNILAINFILGYALCLYLWRKTRHVGRLQPQINLEVATLYEGGGGRHTHELGSSVVCFTYVSDAMSLGFSGGMYVTPHLLQPRTVKYTINNKTDTNSKNTKCKADFVLRQEVMKAYGEREGRTWLTGKCVEMRDEFQFPKTLPAIKYNFVCSFDYFTKFCPLPGPVICHLHRYLYYRKMIRKYFRQVYYHSI